MSTAWTDARDRGWLMSMAIVACRIVPENLIRFRRFRIYRLMRPENQSLPSSDDGPKIELVQCQQAEQFRRLASLTRTKVPADTNGVSGWIAKVNRQEIGGLWLASQRFNEHALGVQIGLGIHQRWLFSAYIAKPHRRKGVYSMMLGQVLGQQPENTEVYAAITNCNQVSHAAHRKYIAAATHSVFALRVLGRTFARAHNLQPGDTALTVQSYHGVRSKLFRGPFER